MTCRLNFTNLSGMGIGSSGAYQADASMTEPSSPCKQRARKRLVRRATGSARARFASRQGDAALSLAACGRIVPLRPNLRQLWPAPSEPREIVWLKRPPEPTGRLWWKPGQVVPGVRRG